MTIDTDTADTAEKIPFSAEISKVLHLMVHSLYTNKDIFLRELISNASDACDKLRYAAITREDLLKDDPELKIRLSVDKDKRILTVSDNGIGMSRDELVTNLGTIAKSGTQEFLNKLSGDSKQDMPLIGQFGVGFYSAFMVADRVEVVSRKAGEEKGYMWSSDGSGEFTVTEAEGDVARGTTINLHIKKGSEEYLDRYRLEHIATTYSDHIAFPIEFVGEDGKVDVLNKASALWARPKSEISEEQYKEFYHHVAHQPDDPWLVMHNKVEGKLEYTSLLFIPSMRPFDLFHPERRRRVKLYVKRVFITDEGVDIIPHYMRFLQGVVDSEDLPLNISRETMQKNPILDKIRDSVVKRVLSELKKKAKSDPEGYAKFWDNFGGVLKEGLCESIAPKENILEVCRFYSTYSVDEGKLIGLEEYIERMKDGQENIYYLTGDNVESMKNHPQLEGFKKRGIEVLLLTDHVDDFWVNVVQKFKDKTFKSVTRVGDELENIDSNLEKDKDDKDNGDKKSDKAKDNEKISKLISWLKQVYGEDVKDIRTTAKLTDSPVCLAVEEGGMDIRLERFLREQKQLPAEAYAKILEINPQHPIITALADRLATSGESADSDDELKDAAFLLLDQARIVEGEEIANPSEFSRRLTTFLSRGLAA